MRLVQSLNDKNLFIGRTLSSIKVSDKCKDEMQLEFFMVLGIMVGDSRGCQLEERMLKISVPSGVVIVSSCCQPWV
jgi:hypothetical protein